MSFEIKGKLYEKYPTESKTDSFQAREFVIETGGSYPQFLKFQLTQDRCDLIENIKEGANVNVFFDLRGREWNEKYFTNLNAWKVAEVKESYLVTAETSSVESAQIMTDDALPF